jgi:hypothetical protein
VGRRRRRRHHEASELLFGRAHQVVVRIRDPEDDADGDVAAVHDRVDDRLGAVGPLPLDRGVRAALDRQREGPLGDVGKGRERVARLQALARDEEDAVGG